MYTSSTGEISTRTWMERVLTRFRVVIGPTVRWKLLAGEKESGKSQSPRSLTTKHNNTTTARAVQITSIPHQARTNNSSSKNTFQLSVSCSVSLPESRVLISVSHIANHTWKENSGHKSTALHLDKAAGHLHASSLSRPGI